MSGRGDIGGDTRGIVDPAAGFERFTLARHQPRDAPDWGVDRYWVVRWDLPPGESHDQRTVPHPAVHLVFYDDGEPMVHAISRAELVRHLEGRGQAVDWADLAAALGYSDQSHLVRDFRAAVGTSPERYARRVARPAR